MFEYWELRFKDGGAMWKFEPSNSAIVSDRGFANRAYNNEPPITIIKTKKQDTSKNNLDVNF